LHTLEDAMENEAASLFRKAPVPSTPAASQGSRQQPAQILQEPARAQRPAIGWALLAVMGLLLTLIVWYGLSRHDTKPTPSASAPAKKPKLTEQELRAAEEALTSVKALESVTSVGVTYADYLRRLGDAKIAVDNASARINDLETRASITDVMTYYGSIGNAWGDKVQSGRDFDPEAYLRIMAGGGCQGAQDVLSRAEREKYPWITRGVYGIPTMMVCAAERVSALQELVQTRKQSRN